MAKQLGVRYAYADTSVVEQVVAPLTADMLTVLPAPLRSELADALESLEGDRISAILAQVKPRDQKLYKQLSLLVDNFDYPTILNALKNKPDEDAT